MRNAEFKLYVIPIQEYLGGDRFAGIETIPREKLSAFLTSAAIWGSRDSVISDLDGRISQNKNELQNLLRICSKLILLGHYYQRKKMGTLELSTGIERLKKMQLQIDSVIRNLERNDRDKRIIQSTRPHVLLADDDPHQSGRVLEALSARGINTTYIKSEQNFERSSGELLANVDIFLIDVMMPSHDWPNICNSFENSSQNAGISLAHSIRKMSKSPIVLWSSAPLKIIGEESIFATRHIENCVFVYKSEGIEIVCDLIKQAKSTGKIDKRLVDKIYDRLILQPNFYGIGIDLKRRKI